MSPPDPAADHRLMGLALAVGRRGLGRTGPNPSVGAVVVAPDGRILATAATAPGGRPHAEPQALAEAGTAARGATLYVSLEPCSHHGWTPPCADAVAAAGLARIVTAIEDPDPRVAGRGHALLRDAGLSVTTGIRAEEAARDHRGHFTRVRAARPWITVKLARTADGYAGTPGARLLVTGEAANARTHMLRAHADAVLVGIGTVLADDPRLDVRLPGLEERSPIRVIVDPGLRMPLEGWLAASAGMRRTFVLCGEGAEHERERVLVGLGVTVLRVPGPNLHPPHAEVAATGGPRSTQDRFASFEAPLRGEPQDEEAEGKHHRPLDLAAALSRLATEGITRILCEGGPRLAEALAEADLVDELVVITSSEPLGRPGIPAFGPRLAALAAGRPISTTTAGPDRIDTYERAGPCSPAS